MQGTTGDRNGNGTAKAGRRRDGWRWSRREALLGSLSLAGVVGALFAGVALATDSLAGVAHGGRRMHAGFFGGGGGFGHHHRQHGPSAEHLDFFVDWTLSKVDANDAQKARAKEIVRDGHAALEPIAAEHRANRERWAAALSAPVIDAAALEDLRQTELRLADALTRRLTGDVQALAELLTPEQRAQFAQRARDWHREED